MNLLLWLANQETPQDPPWWFTLLPFALIFVIFYFLLIRPKRTEEKKRREMLGNIKRGDRVMTIGGIIGKVLETTDEEVVLKVDESANVKIRFRRSAIHESLEDASDEAKSTD